MRRIVDVSGADLSADALVVAAQNIARHGLQKRITLCCGGIIGLPCAKGEYCDLPGRPVL